MTTNKTIDNHTPKEEALTADQFQLMAINRIKSLLANPDISRSQKKTLLNILRNLEQRQQG